MFDGQSLVYSPSNDTALPNTAQSTAAGLGPAITAAVSGTTYTQRASSVATRVDSHAKNAGESFLIDIGGTSDLAADVSAASLLSTVESYADARRAAGFKKVIVTTVPPYTGFSGAQETQRLAYNASLVANANGKFDAVADPASHASLDDASDTNYYYDGLHWTAAAVAIVAGLFRSALASLGVS